MSVESLAVVLHHSRSTGTAKLVLIGIANHDGDGGAWPTVGTLAKYAGINPRGVQKALARLRSLGEISVEQRAGGTADCPDGLRPNRYRILVGCPVWCDRSTQHRDTRARQAPLWKNPTSPASPPVRADVGVPSPGTGDPLSAGTSKPSLQTPVEPVSLSTTDRARATDPTLSERCGVCSHTRYECTRRTNLHPDGHLFEPTRSRP